MGKNCDLSDFNLGTIVSARWGWFEYFCNCWSPGIFTQDGGWCEKPVSGSSADRNTWSTENGQTGSIWQKVYGNSDNHTVHLCWAEKRQTSRADGLPQKKTTSGSTSVSQEQKAEAAVGLTKTGQLKTGKT